MARVTGQAKYTNDLKLPGDPPEPDEEPPPEAPPEPLPELPPEPLPELPLEPLPEPFPERVLGPVPESSPPRGPWRVDRTSTRSWSSVVTTWLPPSVPLTCEVAAGSFRSASPRPGFAPEASAGAPSW
jgi:hypothetical protein